MTTVFEPVIGIEIHAQLKTKTKLFSDCPVDASESPNTNICPLTLALPGTLPVLNQQAVDYAIQAGLALNCEIQPTSVFSRKNYFYPDLPKGYQISQFEYPICLKGHIKIKSDGNEKVIGITRIHMEEDAGKLLHQGAESIAGATHSLVDLNRAGTPLIEIVSEPDIRSAKEARDYVETIRLILVHAGVCDGDMQSGNLRADINISLRPVGQKKFGTRAEIKNVNSFRAIESAVEYEIIRQSDLLNQGKKVIQETRNYDDSKQVTTSLRSKADAHDYRYFPEPDLLPLIISSEHIEALRKSLPMLPEEKIENYIKQGMTKKEAEILVSDVALNTYFEHCLSQANGVTPTLICNWVLGDLSALVNQNKTSFDKVSVSPQSLLSLLNLLKSKKISGKMAKNFLITMYEQQKEPEQLLKESGGGQISDESELDKLVLKVLDENPDVVEKIKNGKVNSANFLMGQVMKLSQGKAQPDTVRELILKKVK